MRARRGLQPITIVAVSALALGALLLALPLPRACDPRRDEVPEARYAELARFSGARTRAEVDQALRHTDPLGQLAPYYTLSDDVLVIRPAASDHTSAVHIALRPPAGSDNNLFSPPQARAWRRIALDPGHHGGTWSRLEKRHVQPPGGRAMREGDLAWASARLVEQRLRAAGAEVTLLRDPPPAAPYPVGADPGFDVTTEAAYRLSDQHPRERPSPLGLPWLTPLAALQLRERRSQLVRTTAFELYTRYDLRRRAQAAGDFAADLTLSLHWDLTPESGRNGVLVFVPGNAVAGDLASASQRFWAFRRVLDGTAAETLRLARALARSLMRHFDLRAMTMDDFHEARAGWRVLDPALGVFARDLAIGRRTPGVTVVLEGPCVNHPDEYPRLLATDLEVDGRRYPARVRQYADAVVDGLRAAAADVQSAP
jgi:N-acetylmuramoyl-L-alanine amidase